MWAFRAIRETAPVLLAARTRFLIDRMKLLGKHRAEQLLHRGQVDLTLRPRGIGRLQSAVIRRPVLLNLLRDRQPARQQRMEADAKHEVRYRPRSPPVPIRKRMDPVQAPHDIRSQVQRALLVPLLVHIVAKLLHALRHLKRRRRLVLAVADLDARGTPVARIRRNAVERRPMKMKQMGWPEFERALAVQLAVRPFVALP